MVDFEEKVFQLQPEFDSDRFKQNFQKQVLKISTEYSQYREALAFGDLSDCEQRTDDRNSDEQKQNDSDNNNARRQKKVRMSFLHSRESLKLDKSNIMVMIHALVTLLTEMQAGVIRLTDCMGISRQPKFSEFVVFLQIMEVYGSGYDDDVDFYRFNNRITETHKEAMLSQLDSLLHVYELMVFTVEQQRAQLLQMISDEHLQKFSYFIKFQQRKFSELYDIQSRKQEQNDHDFQIAPEGHLVYLSCGHRGQPSRMEEKRISRLLRKARFIPLLEQAASVQGQETPRASKGVNFSRDSALETALADGDKTHSPAKLFKTSENGKVLDHYESAIDL